MLWDHRQSQQAARVCCKYWTEIHHDMSGLLLFIHVQLICAHKWSFQGYELPICVHKLSLQYLVWINTDPSPTCPNLSVYGTNKHTDPWSVFCFSLSSSFLHIDPHRVDSLMVEWLYYPSHNRHSLPSLVDWKLISSRRASHQSSKHWITSPLHVSLLCLFSYVLIKNPCSSPLSLYFQFVALSFHHSVTEVFWGRCGCNPWPP